MKLMTQHKKALTAYDDKRLIMDDGIKTEPYVFKLKV